jgi:type IV secretion system protein VirB10
MKRNWIIGLLAIGMMLSMSFPTLGYSHPTLSWRAQRHRQVTLPTDTFFRLRLNQGLSSKTAQVDDQFTAQVIAPVVRENLVVVPEGATIQGRVTSVQPAARRRSGTIAVSFEKLILPDGGEYSIRGSLANHQEEVDEEGRVKGKSTTKRDVIFIGGGAGVGAVIGAAAGGGKGAGIGAAIGAGVGVAGALLRKGYEAEVKSGTEIGMVLDQEITVAVAR